MPIEPLVFFRLSFGGLMVWEVLRYLDKGWVKRFWIDPGFHFSYYGFGWLRPWPGDGMTWHFVALGVLAAMLGAGLAYRAAAGLFFLGFSYVFLLDQTTYLNHFYLIALLAGIAAFLSPHRAFSIDSWRSPALRRSTAPAWQLLLLRTQVALVYVFAGIAKLNADWLRGQPLRMWLASREPGSEAVARWLDSDAAAMAFSYGGLVFDLAIVPALLWRRTRIPAFAVAIAFHTANAYLFSIGIFPWLMIALTALFFPADAFARIARRPAPDRAPAAPVAAAGAAPMGRGAASLLALYLAIQVALPLRHWLYPGEVAWTEEGHRFAWRMKLRDKVGKVRFDAADPDGAVVARVDPGEYLNRGQVRAMAVRPDLILQFAHFLADDLERRGYGRVAIRARTAVRLNGHAPQALIDPRCDLAAAPRDLRPAGWILPFARERDGEAERPGDTAAARRRAGTLVYSGDVRTVAQLSPPWPSPSPRACSSTRR